MSGDLCCAKEERRMSRFPPKCDIRCFSFARQTCVDDARHTMFKSDLCQATRLIGHRIRDACFRFTGGVPLASGDYRRPALTVVSGPCAVP